MERKIESFLKRWQKDIIRKPLILYGPKQIGKTYSAIEFGEKYYKTIAYFNASNNRELLEIMRNERTIDKIIFKLSLLNGETILKDQ